MIESFVEGGWGMWPILIFGMVTLGAAARFAQLPRLAYLRFVAGMALTTLVSTIHATWLCLGSVFKFLEDSTRAPTDEMPRILMVGLKESTRPGSLGGLLLALACLLTAVGLLRLGRERGSAPSI